MDKISLGLKLKELRESKFDDRNAFARAAGLEIQAVVQAEEGKRVLVISRLQKWCETCGTTLPRFLAEFEGQDTQDVRIVPGFELYYRLLTEIIETKQKFFIEGIHANLVAMASAAKGEESGQSIRAGPRPLKPRRASSH